MSRHVGPRPMKACRLSRPAGSHGKEVLGTDFQELECKQTWRLNRCVWYRLSCVWKSLKNESDCGLSSVSQFHLAAPTTSLLSFAALLLVKVMNIVARDGKKIRTRLSFCRDVVRCHYDTLHGIKPNVFMPNAHFCSRRPASVGSSCYHADM